MERYEWWESREQCLYKQNKVKKKIQEQGDDSVKKGQSDSERQTPYDIHPLYLESI